ncbi:hypothetical protein CRG98_032031 [Punica granatum]|uniref:Uncharacterized protein n=1 Tax=Punica granatum TaxID=22663 RepID=A0A2I0IW05_PUNGR|nr:hypothetical protein CRG98_032031 [Punica granatum]
MGIAAKGEHSCEKNQIKYPAKLSRILRPRQKLGDNVGSTTKEQQHFSVELHRVVVRHSPTQANSLRLSRLETRPGMGSNRRTIRNPKGCSPLTASCLTHAASHILEAPEIVEGCASPPKPTVYPGSFGSIPALNSLFRPILASFGSIPVLFSRHRKSSRDAPHRPNQRCSKEVYPGSFGSIPAINSVFRPILASFGSIPVLISSAISQHVQARRIPDQSPGYYSSPGNRRRTCGHRVMNDRRRAESIRKVEESSQKNLQAKNPENSGVGTMALFITESLKHRKLISLQNPLKLQPIPTPPSSPCQGRNRPKPAKITGKPPGIPIFDLKPPTSHSNRRESRVPWVTRVHAGPLRVPFRPTTLPSRAIPFKGFLTTLSLPREEVVTVRGPISRAPPPFHHFSLTGFFVFILNFFSLFQACPGLGTFGSVHGHLDLPLRSPTNPISHRAVAGASVPTRFPETVAAEPLSGHSTRSSKPSLSTPLPLPRLLSSCIKAR